MLMLAIIIISLLTLDCWKSLYQSFHLALNAIQAMLNFFDDLTYRMAYSHKLTFFCHICSCNIETFTSEKCEKSINVQGRKKIENNVRVVAVFWEIGKGHEEMINAARCMNMFCIGETSYRTINDALHDAYEHGCYY